MQHNHRNNSECGQVTEKERYYNDVHYEDDEKGEQIDKHCSMEAECNVVDVLNSVNRMQQVSHMTHIYPGRIFNPMSDNYSSPCV